jgi:hypothetical protein
MAKIIDYFRIVAPKPESTAIQDSQGIDGQGASYGNYTWYQRLVQGSATRLTRYREYDIMDQDIEVTRALDTIAEEMTGRNTKTNLPMDIDIQAEDGQDVPDNIVLTIRAALRHWGNTHDFHNKLFNISRNTIKYGDCFFRKENNHKIWEWIPPSNILAAVVDAEDVTKIVGYQVRTDTKAPKTGGSPGISTSQDYHAEYLSAAQVVRFTLNDDMSTSAPFGDSVLRSVYRTHKQKQLLEDAIIIYRIQRAPERRVFYIDVGKMPPQRVKTYLETIKNEIRQKKIPSMQGGQNSIDSSYNPQSMTEDFFFASRPDGRGSKVETLPGGQGLGELSDLDYFADKVLRGLRVPISWMKPGSEGAIFNDGKLGASYIEEQQFAKFVKRLQGYIETTIDKEFKSYLRTCNINIDESYYKLKFPDPNNYEHYRQADMDNTLLSSYGTADGVAYLSKRFILSRYLQLSDDEIITNEMLLRQEKGMSLNGGDADLPTIYGAGGEDAGLGIGGGIGGGGLPPASGGPIGELDNGGEPGTGSESTSGGPSTNAGGSPLSGDLNSV